MQCERKSCFAFFLLLMICSMRTAHAQLGEVAGEPFFNVSIGSKETIQVTIINAGSTPLPFKVILPTLNNIVNTTQPSVSADPMNGTILPSSSIGINITVYMPYDKRNIGHTWTGILQVVEISNRTPMLSTGAVVLSGVAKIITIYASKPKQTPLFLYYGEFIAGVAIVVLFAVIFAISLRRRMWKKSKERNAKSKKARSANGKRSSRAKRHYKQSA
ncbi:MAG: hypothetical protein QXL16_00745 [Candidatus Micrarchaeaceae archaeon]